MNMLIPGKDTILLLARFQKKIIRELNLYLDSGNAMADKNCFAIPQYPLFAPLPEDCGETGCNIAEVTIMGPAVQQDILFFPVECQIEGLVKTEIPFARISCPDIIQDDLDMEKIFRDGSLGEEIKKAFPKRERSFKTASVIFENNGWNVFEEKWHTTRQ